MPSIQSLGVGSGLDARGIITQLLAVERQPLQRLQAAASDVQTQISAFGTVRAKVDALGSAAQALADADTWSETTVNLNGSQALKVTATSNAEPVDLEISVTALAQRQSIATNPLVDPLPSMSGTLTIELGSWTTGFGVFTPQASASPVNITIDNGDSLTEIRDKINGEPGIGVTASILSDATGVRLVLRSQDTGEDNGFRITADDASLEPLTFDEDSIASRNNSHAPGDPDPNPDHGFMAHVRGSNLQATVNGAPVLSTSNTMTDVLDGVTIQALKPTTDTESVLIERDLASSKARIEGFVSAYNELMSYVRQQTAYNAETQTAATLQGDRVTLGLQSSLRNTVTDASQASAVFERLSSIGLELQPDGSLKTNIAKLDTALKNLPEVAALFGRDELGSTQDGVARRLADLVDELTGTGGRVSAHQDSLAARLKRNQDQQSKMNDRLAIVEARLQAQYSALDTKMASLGGISQYVTQQVQLLSNSN